jgi:hypothetical protein
MSRDLFLIVLKSQKPTSGKGFLAASSHSRRQNVKKACPKSKQEAKLNLNNEMALFHLYG